MPEDKKKDIRSRRRGVRASRVKLTEALTAAGVRTQTALADRIAELEGLDAAPRDAVYRVFRQQPVDLKTLTRVARALDRPVHSLLLSSDETDPPAPHVNLEPAEVETAPVPGPPSRWPRVLTAAAVAVASALTWYAIARWPADERPATSEPPALRDLSGLAVVVRPFEGDAGIDVAEALRDALSPGARVASAGAAAMGSDEDSAAVARRFNADVVVEGRVVGVGRHVGLRTLVWHEGQSRTVWTTSTTKRALATDHLEEIAADIVLALRGALSPGAELRELPSVSAQVAYLRGRQHLDGSRTELNVKRAMTRFVAALRDHADYARARAGLCQALVQESLISSEGDTLADAEEECARAHELDPRLPEVRLARAALARRSGRHEEAGQILAAVLEETPDDAEALIEMAENELAVYRKGGGEEARLAAVDFAERATKAERDFWKAPFTLARVHFFTGNVEGAIRAGEAAVIADANEHSVTNLGTFYFCRGDHDQALALYLRAGDIAPLASLGEEQMCVAYYFAREFDRAVSSCEAAIKADTAGGSPARHEMWGNLADAYRQAEQPADAADAYARAAELAERALLTRGHSPNVRAHLAYYYTVLRRLDAQRVPDSFAEKVEGDLIDLSASATDPQALIRIASAWALIGRTEEARAAYVRGTADCAGFGASPDLDGVRP